MQNGAFLLEKKRSCQNFCNYFWFSAVFSQFVKSDSTFLTNSILVITASAIDCIWYILVALIVTSYGLKDFFQKRINAIQKISGSVLVIISILLIINFF